MSTNHRFKLKKHQTGSALIIGLTILLLMLILGTAGMRTTIMEERMAGNSRDYNNAFQAAEAGLLDGEQDIKNKDFVTEENLRIGSYYPENDFTTDCDNGLCKPATGGDNPQWLVIDWDRTTAPLPYRIYGQCTTLGSTSPSSSNESCVEIENTESTPAYTKTNAPPPLPVISRQPRYIIESLSDGSFSGGGGSLTIGKNLSAAAKYFRITAQGYGIATTDDTVPRPIARVTLQSIYGK